MVRALRVHARGALRQDAVPAPRAAPNEAVVRVLYGGICGSDVHYWRDGAVGAYVLRAPMVLGHEIVGTVAVAAADGSGPEVGASVAVHPAVTCGTCRWCTSGRPNLCPDYRYLGSAAQWPHTDGGFTDELAVATPRLARIPSGVELRRASLAEPAAVAWHAANRAKAVGAAFPGSRVLIVGAGPIGLLMTAVVLHLGAHSTVVTDLYDGPLSLATRLGAQQVMKAPALSVSQDLRLDVDMAFECSGSAAGLAIAMENTRRAGTVVAIGQLPKGDLPVPASALVSKEMTVTGSLRVDDDLRQAVDFLSGCAAPVGSIVSHVYPLDDAAQAFEVAADAARSSKVLLDFSL